jgi:hypothetical protein
VNRVRRLHYNYPLALRRRLLTVRLGQQRNTLSFLEVDSVYV